MFSFSSRESTFLRTVSLLIAATFLGCSGIDDNPTVEITSPVSGAWLEDVVTVTVSVDDDGEISRVSLFADGEIIGVTSNIPNDGNLEFSWDTQSSDTGMTEPGTYVLTATVEDEDDNSTESDPVGITVLYPVKLTSSSEKDIQPSWSPDGSQIIFKTNRLDENPDIYKIFTVSPETKEETQIVTDRDYHGYPGWSPGGDYVVFNSYDIDEYEWWTMDIFTAPATGGETQRLMNDTHFDDSGEWSPDGSQIAFHSSRSGYMDL
ncbi:MAG TPA: hypothetical protein EYO08_04600, partial [Candidatus Marinimicrobia bacterium]|nr:hypothetical protein [Candidatus Neomarinimicrobiota bacterium]